jgi:hypothetical protein
LRYSPLLLFSFLLSTSSSLSAQIAISDCGQGFDTLSGELKNTPFKRYYCDTKNVKNNIEEVKIIHNYIDLIQLLNISYNKDILKNHFIQKLIHNPYINQYTITLAYYASRDLYENYIKEKEYSPDFNITNIEKYGNSYIQSVRSGGQHLILYHIQTKSKREYELILKRVNKKINSIKALKEYLSKLSSENIVIKEYFSKNLLGTPVNTLNESFQQSDYFKTLVEEKPVPYRYLLNYYKTSSQKTKEEENRLKIQKLFEIQFFINSYNYFRHNNTQFPNISEKKKMILHQKISSLKHILAKTIQQEEFTDINLSASYKELPSRHTAYATLKTFTLNKENITLQLENIHEKTNPKKDIKLTLTTKIDIKNHGKVTRLENQLAVTFNNHHEQIKQTKILFDSYVNFPSLRFKNIQNNYGIIQFSFPFNKYTQEKEIKGSGIIKQAFCGYDLNTQGIMTIYCKNIKYADIKIELVHEQ